MEDGKWEICVIKKEHKIKRTEREQEVWKTGRKAWTNDPLEGQTNIEAIIRETAPEFYNKHP